MSSSSAIVACRCEVGPFPGTVAAVTATLDPRLNACRPDLADARLKGEVEAARFVEGTARRVVAAAAPLKRTPRTDASLDSEVLRGEIFTVFEETHEGWTWGQLATDRYVGYVATDALGPIEPEPSHRIAALRTFIYPGPDMKLPALGWVSVGSAVALDREATTRGTVYRQIVGGEGWIVAVNAVPLDAPAENDFVSVAERFVNTAYLWGGRTSLGLDCSSLVQLSLMAAGIAAPRDTDLQEAALGSPVEGGVAAPLHRGDLVFWLGHHAGHVGIMIDGEYLIHANGHHMAVVIEPLADVSARIAAKTIQPTSVRRL
jgi:cell wall-associated NlpC family hydrolase